MRKGGQKAKGNAHQRAVAKIFTEAYYPDGDGEFKSTPGSGSWDKRAAPGDIIAFKYIKDSDNPVGMIIDSTFPLVVECKDWKDEHVKHFVSGLYSKECQFFGWLEQAQGDTYWVKKMPVVVFKLYRQPNVVILSEMDFNKIAQLFGNFPGKIYTLEKIMPKQHIEHTEQYQKLIFILLKDFIEWIDWHVYKLASKYDYVRSLKEEK